MNKQPQFRIVTNGRRYRVQEATSERDCATGKLPGWRDVQDLVAPPYTHVAISEARAGIYRNIYGPFETRFLWRAKLRLRREIRKAGGTKEQARPLAWLPVIP